VAIIIEPLDGSKFGASEALLVRGTAHDNKSVSSVTLTLSDTTNSSTQAFTATLSDGGKAWSVVLAPGTLVPKHTYILSVKARDGADNLQTVTSSVSFTAVVASVAGVTKPITSSASQKTDTNQDASSGIFSLRSFLVLAGAAVIGFVVRFFAFL
jgi:hypothetical protein